jgi:hypothetical protein
MEGIATLTEILTSWSITDLYDAHEALDLKAEADAYYQKKIIERSKKT